jgi:DedD protein
MKLVIDEKLKHRLVGLAVVLSLGAMFLPGMMKKSSQRLEHHFSVNVQLPPKPKAPNVAITDKKEMFQTIKVAHIKIPPMPKQRPSDSKAQDYIQSIELAKEKALSVEAKKAASNAETLTKPIELALNNAVKKNPVVTPKAKPLAAVARINKPSIKQVIAQNPSLKKEIYAVQLASFSKLSNAEALVGKLQGKGYKANYIKSSGRNGVIYKVYVGYSPIKSEVMKLRTQLASAMQLDGFVVNTGVS